ncbi:MAG: apolipoprotein N-acyltransferase [Legionellaceae bacterium]|nr:apolipoprotein N-acyltransferase [Legionellaceae bacterium]
MTATTTSKTEIFKKQKSKYLYLLRALFAGIILPLGFAPFHFPGLAILGLGLLFAELQNKSTKESLITGFIFGLGYMGFGVSWIYISIHSYGHLDKITSAFITLVFISYLSLFLALVAGFYKLLSKNQSRVTLCFLFSACWCLGEFLRSTCFSGFPWLNVGFGQIDSPLKHLLPIIGVYGVSFVTCFIATLLINSYKKSKLKLIYLTCFVSVLLLPLSLKSIPTSNISEESIPIGVVQANLSMRDKWDEDIFLQILAQYRQGIHELINKAKIIILPESAIPVPEVYVGDFIDEVNLLTKEHSNTLLIGIPKTEADDEDHFYNTLTAYGQNNGAYSKQHLVPFGEYIPGPFLKLAKWFNIPDANMLAAKKDQPLIVIDNRPIASLICYEVAYPSLLRKQFPKAQWIVSISDDGWFGHSLAIYQQQQMSQVLSMLTGRYQIIANNDGLSSIIDNHGNIISSLPAFSSDNLYGTIRPATGESIWLVIGDKPILFLSILITMIAFFRQRRYAY